MEKPLSTNYINQNLLANMPVDWIDQQRITSDGSLYADERYGYKYLNEQINNAQNAVKEINNAFESVPSVVTSARVVSNNATYSAAATTARSLSVLYTLDPGEFVSGVTWDAYTSQSMEANGGMPFVISNPTIGSSSTSISFVSGRTSGNSGYTMYLYVFISKIGGN